MSEEVDNELLAMTGGEYITVLIKPKNKHEAPVSEQVFVRELEVDEILGPDFIPELKSDYFGYLDRLLGKEKGWSKTLTRQSYRELRQLESKVNFEFALEELTEATSRGQKLAFMDEMQMDQIKKTINLISSLGFSPNMQSSPGQAAAKSDPSAYRGFSPLSDSQIGQKRSES